MKVPKPSWGELTHYEPKSYSARCITGTPDEAGVHRYICEPPRMVKKFLGQDPDQDTGLYRPRTTEEVDFLRIARARDKAEAKARDKSRTQQRALWGRIEVKLP